MRRANRQIGPRAAPWGVLAAAWALLALGGCGKTAEEYLTQANDARTLEERERLLTQALKADPGLKVARLQRAWVYALQGDLSRSLADYDTLNRTTRSARDKGAIFFWRGRSLERNDQLEEAVESYAAALRCAPEVIDPYAARAGVYFRLGKYANAMQDYLTMLKRDIQKTGPRAAARRARWRLRRAFAGFCAGEWASAAGDFEAAIEGLDSAARKARAVLNLYFVACRIGNKEKADAALRVYAEETYERYTRGGRLSPWIFRAVWYVAQVKGQGEAAFLASCQHERVETQASRLAVAHYYIGARHLVTGASEKALASFRRCAEHKDDRSVEHHMATVETGRLLAGGKTADDYVVAARRAGSPKQKIEMYSKALRVDPEHTDARLNRAMLYTLNGQFAEALADYTRLLELYKRPINRAVAFRYRAWAHALKGDHLAAVKDYRAAIKADPALWEARQGLALSLARLRRYAEAAATYRALTQLISGGHLAPLWRRQRAYALCCAGEWRAAADELRRLLRRPGAALSLHALRYIAECKLGNRTTAQTAVRAFAAKIKMVSWDGSVVWYVADMLDDDGLLKASKHSEDKVELERTSRAHYYIGAGHLIKGEKAKARAAFDRCVRLNAKLPGESWECRLATIELANTEQWR